MAKERQSRSKRAPKPGSQFFSGVLADNLRAIRGMKALSQAHVAQHMQNVGHPTWSRTTVDNVESSKRSVSIDEFFGLCLVLMVAPIALLDAPRSTVQTVDVGAAEPIPATVATDWV